MREQITTTELTRKLISSYRAMDENRFTYRIGTIINLIPGDQSIFKAGEYET
jgi:hypothetical protein